MMTDIWSKLKSTESINTRKPQRGHTDYFYVNVTVMYRYQYRYNIITYMVSVVLVC